LASYWFQAGKGPDPAKTSLDTELESYKAAAAVTGEEAPAETAAESAIESEVVAEN